MNALSHYLIVIDALLSPEKESQYTVSTTGTKQAVTIRKWEHLVVCLCNCMVISFTTMNWCLVHMNYFSK